MKRFTGTVLVVFLFCGTGASPGMPKNAAGDLQQSVQDLKPKEAAAAANLIAEGNDAGAVRELVSALKLCAKTDGTLLAEHKKILDEKRRQNLDPTEKPRREARDQVDGLHGRHHGLCVKIHNLLLIRREIRKALGKMNGELLLKDLIAGMKAKGNPVFQADCALALSSVKGEKAMDALVAVLSREKEGAVRVAALRAMSGRADGDRAVKTAGPLLRDPHWQVATAAARFLGAAKSTSAVPLLIDGLKSTKDGKVLQEINKALVALTGENKHANHGAWKNWWERNGEKLKTSPPPAPAEGSPSNDGIKGSGTTAFYGIPVESTRLVFVIDGSGSMQHESAWQPPSNDVATGKGAKGTPFVEAPKDNLKISVAQYELKKVLAMLPDGVHFNIIFFNHTAWPFSKNGMTKLDRRTRAEASTFVDGIVLMPATDVYYAMRMAFEHAGILGSGFKTDEYNADTVYLLSDGMPHLREMVLDAGGVASKDAIQDHVRDWNINAAVKIHTISIQQKDRERGSKLLEDLAGEHDGTYVER